MSLGSPPSVTMPTALHDRLPWTSSPLIVNAPMGGFAGADLAIAVTKAGGLGQIGAVDNMKALGTQLEQVFDSLKDDPQLDCSATLPIGVGLLPYILKIHDALAVLSKFNPAVIWLFAAKQIDDYATWAKEIQTIYNL